MKFGPLDVAAADGAILAHSLDAGGMRLRKGLRLGASDVVALLAAGIASVPAARLEPGDVHEDEAASRLAARLAGRDIDAAGPFTGRANLHATAGGLFVADREAVDRLNRVDPSITLATLPSHSRVTAGQMVGTVKIIPFAVDEAQLGRAEALAAEPMLKVAAFTAQRVGLVATSLPGLRPSVMDKTRLRLEARLAAMGSSLCREIRVPHEPAAVACALAALAAEGADLIVVFGASAMVDRGDVVPAGIEAAGGTILRLGMPVDPGNLLVLAELDGRPVIGAPGCARSPKENGFDWILQRRLAGLSVTSDDIAALGVGGLLSEISSRPQPRERRPAEPSGVAALVLAAGQGRRMGGPNKLLAEIDGRSLVRGAAEAALASRAASVTVVTGHESEVIAAALAGLALAFRFNPDYRDGLSTSLRAGVAALPDDAEAVLVLLADMPLVTSALLDRLIEAFATGSGGPIVVPTFGGRRGNPVLWPRRFFGELMAVEGDAGARQRLSAHAAEIVEVEIGEAAALDLDTPEALARAGGRIVAG